MLKKQRFIGYFVADQQAPFYQSPTFSGILQFVQSHPGSCRLKEKQTRSGLRLLLIYEEVHSVKDALKVTDPLIEFLGVSPEQAVQN